MNLKEKFEAFEKAYLELTEALEDETEVNYENYPFEKSFDEYIIGIMEWCGDNAHE